MITDTELATIYKLTERTHRNIYTLLNHVYCCIQFNSDDLTWYDFMGCDDLCETFKINYEGMENKSIFESFVNYLICYDGKDIELFLDFAKLLATRRLKNASISSVMTTEKQP